MNLPNLYFEAPMSTASETQKHFSRLAIEFLSAHGNVLSEHIGEENILEKERIRVNDGLNIHERDTMMQNDADAFAADVSEASTGVGVEVIQGMVVQWKPQLGMYRTGSPVSKMVSQLRHPQLTLREYHDEASLKQVIDEYFGKFRVSWRSHPRFIQCDAIDGAGKGAVTAACREVFEERGMRVVDIDAHSQEIGYIPSWQQVLDTFGSVDALLVAEPTKVEMGRIIREEFINSNHGRTYGFRTTAAAYAADREILYKRLLLDALNEGKFVFEDRGCVTSCVYQHLQAHLWEGVGKELALSIILGLPGNRLAMDNVPGLLMLPHVDVDVALQRLESREKKDNAIFEQADFLSEAAMVYASGRIKRLFTHRGSQVVDFDTRDCPLPEDTVRKAKGIIKAYLDETD